MTTSIFDLLALAVIFTTIIMIGFGIGRWTDFGRINERELYKEPIINISCPPDNISLDCPQPNVITECPNCKYECPDCECGECQYVTTIYTSHFQKIITGICEEKKYILDEWDCSDMTEEGISRLRNAGYKGFRMSCGWYYNQSSGKDKERHCWGTNGNFLIEFTNCMIVQPDDYWRYKKS